MKYNGYTSATHGIIALFMTVTLCLLWSGLFTYRDIAANNQILKKVLTHDLSTATAYLNNVPKENLLVECKKGIHAQSIFNSFLENDSHDIFPMVSIGSKKIDFEYCSQLGEIQFDKDHKQHFPFSKNKDISFSIENFNSIPVIEFEDKSGSLIFFALSHAYNIFKEESNYFHSQVNVYFENVLLFSFGKHKEIGLFDISTSAPDGSIKIVTQFSISHLMDYILTPESIIFTIFLFFVLYELQKLYFKSSKQQLKLELSRALYNKEFIPFYQPIVNVKTEELVAVELLVRWKKGSNYLPPNLFIEKLETTDLIIPVTQQLMEQSFKDLKPYFRQSKNFYCSVNITARHFESRDLYNHLKNKDKNINLALEITERSPIKDLRIAAEYIQSLKEIGGISISLDDAGTGYGGNSYLHLLNIDTVKIDRLFTSSLRQGARSDVIDQYIRMCQNLELKIIAEGVETEEEKQALLTRNVNTHQGYFYAKPMDINDFNTWYAAFLADRKQ